MTPLLIDGIIVLVCALFMTLVSFTFVKVDKAVQKRRASKEIKEEVVEEEEEVLPVEEEVVEETPVVEEAPVKEVAPTPAPVKEKPLLKIVLTSSKEKGSKPLLVINVKKDDSTSEESVKELKSIFNIK